MEIFLSKYSVIISDIDSINIDKRMEHNQILKIPKGGGIAIASFRLRDRTLVLQWGSNPFLIR